MAASEGNLRTCGLGKAANSLSRILSAAWETEGRLMRVAMRVARSWDSWSSRSWAVRWEERDGVAYIWMAIGVSSKGRGGRVVEGWMG